MKQQYKVRYSKEVHKINNTPKKRKKGFDTMYDQRDIEDILVSLPIALAIILLIWIGLNFLGLWLWGIIAVQIFGLPALTFWQFFGLRLLLAIIIPTSNLKWNKSEGK